MKYDVGKHLTRRFVVAAGFLAASAAGGFVVADYHTRTASRDAEITNLAGRQRMLTESIAHLASHPAENQSRNELIEKIGRMREEIEVLTGPDSGYLDAAEVRVLCTVGEQAIHPRVLTYLAAAENDDKETIAALHKPLVADLDRAVTAYAAYAARRMTVLRGIEAAGFAVQLLVLWLAWRLIFRPMSRRIDRDVRMLEDSQRRTRAILDAAGEGICGIDPQGCIVFINDAGCRLLGCDRDAALGANLHTLAHHHDAGGNPLPMATCPVLQTAMAGTQRQFELDSFWRSDGSRFPVEVVIAPLHGHDGFVGAVLVFRDISERKAAEACRDLSSNVLNHITECVFVTTPDGVITRINPAFSVVTGFQSEEALGQTPRILKSGRHDAAFYRAMWEEIGARGCWQGELWNRRKDGEGFCARQSVTAIRDGYGEVTHYVSVFKDITDHKATEDRIRLQAYHDHLTGLPNRSLFMDRLKLTLAQSRRNDRPLTLMFIDLDHFKEINDRLGHAAGDAVLCETASRMQESLRDSDTVARRGGDEFTVLLVETTAADATVVAEKMLQRLAMPFAVAGETVRIGASIGIARFPQDGDDAETLIGAADAAMYAVKAAGRNGVRLA